MRYLLVPLLVACVLLSSPLSARAQKTKKKIVIFKDGFVVYGKVTRPTVLEHDSKTGHSVSIPVLGGFYYVDDDVRTVSFSPNQVHEAIDDESDREKKYIRLGIGYTRPGDPLPNSWTVVSSSPFSDKLERTLQMETSRGDFPIYQRMAALTPKSIHLQAKSYTWIAGYYTREFSPELVRGFVLKSMRARQKDQPRTPYQQREMLYVFLLQAGWLDHAEKELNEMIRTFPAQRKKLEELRNGLQTLIAAKYVEAMEQASKVGQHQEAQERLGRFYELGMHKIANEDYQQRYLPRAQALKLKYAAANEKLKEVRRLFPRITKRGLPPLHASLYRDMVATILSELTYDTLPRLETFIGQAQDWERALRNNRPPNCTPEQLLGFAVSGWLLGDSAAERDPALARRLWQARKLVLETQLDDDPGVRQQRARSFAADKTVAVDVVARMIPNLPPADPYQQTDTDRIKLGGAGAAAYHVQLPPEYNHFRPYPVLIVLHHSKETAEKELSRWTELAARHGFIVAAPVWADGGKGKVAYQYTPREHAAVLGCLRDLRRRFQIDSDRVFLFGCEEGGRMAYDVGLSHPDLFAGVMPMSASPRYFPFRYTSNAQHLPFYVVNGQFTGQKAKDNRAMFKDWIRWSYPSLLVEYKGRASEYFTGEQETIFDWMSRKKRFTPLRILGRSGEEFKTMRPTDNRFYWLSTEQVDIKFQNSKALWNQGTPPATMYAIISSGNQINIRTHGLGQVTLWLGPGMLNYREKVHLRLNGATVFAARLIQPRLEVLLDEFARTGDRQRLFWECIPLRP